MKKILASLIGCLIIGCFLFPPLSPQKPDQAYAVNITNRYVLVFNEGVTETQIASIVTTAGATLVRTLPEIRMALVNVPSSIVLNLLSSNPNVHSMTQPKPISFSHPVENAPIPTPYTSIYNNRQWHIRRTGADQVWATGETGSHDTVVAVIDVGIADNHPQLAPNIVYEKCFSQIETPCTNYPRFPSIIAVLPGDHGTFVAGIIASTFSNIGTIGVGPNLGLANYNVAELVDGTPTAYDASIWESMYDAANQGFEVINLSAGNLYPVPLSPELQTNVDNWNLVLEYVHKKGSLFVTASMNDNINLDDPNTLLVPCELNDAFCVGATNARPQPEYPQTGFYEERTFYSGYSPTKLGIAAPGGDCGPNSICYDAMINPLYFTYSTSVQANPICALLQNCPIGYTGNIGTSVSTPHVAGVAGLVYNAYFHAKGVRPTPDKVRKILRDTADAVSGYPELGVGSIDAVEAVEKARE